MTDSQTPDEGAQTFVVGMDGSDRAADALALAEVMAAPLRASVVMVFVHAFERAARAMEAPEYERLVREVTAAMLASPAAPRREAAERDLRVVGAGSPAGGLVSVAETEHASLIVVGSARKSLPGRVRAGRAAQALLAGSPCPVGIAVRDYAGRRQPLGTIGVAFDEGPESERALQWAAALAAAAGAELRIIGVHEPVAFDDLPLSPIRGTSVNRAMREERRTQLDEALERVPGVRATAQLLEADPATALVRVSSELDLLAMGSRGYGPLRAVLLGSVSRVVVNEAACSVVVGPRKATSTTER